MLKSSRARYKIVAAHKPAWPFHRHTGSVLGGTREGRDRFWKALAEGGCQMYLCGHTHHYSTYQWLGNADPKRWQGYTSRIMPAPLAVWQVDAGCARGPERGKRYDRVVVYFKVTGKCIEVEAHVAPATKAGSGPWSVPASSATTRYRFKVYPDSKANLSARTRNVSRPVPPHPMPPARSLNS